MPQAGAGQDAEPAEADGDTEFASASAPGTVVVSHRNPTHVYRSPIEVYRDPQLGHEDKASILEKWVLLANAKYRESGDLVYLDEVRDAYNLLSFLRRELEDF